MEVLRHRGGSQQNPQNLQGLDCCPPKQGFRERGFDGVRKENHARAFLLTTEARMEEFDSKRLAEEAYNAYAAQAEWKTPEGRPMPDWAHAGRAEQERWRAVVRFVAHRMTAQVRRAA
jgi:hypothetical protein